MAGKPLSGRGSGKLGKRGEWKSVKVVFKGKIAGSGQGPCRGILVIPHKLLSQEALPVVSGVCDPVCVHGCGALAAYVSTWAPFSCLVMKEQGETCLHGVKKKFFQFFKSGKQNFTIIFFEKRRNED